jgi:protein O-mannosyl-transferase
MKRKQTPTLSQTPAWMEFLPYVFTGILTFILYWPVRKFEFTNWDDQVYITGNEMIRALDTEHLMSIFSEFVMGNYHPLVMLGYALEYKLSGLDAGVFHMTNVVLHLFSGWLLISVFRQFQFRPDTAAALAGIFLVHPFHVESVAWVTERKDVLYGLFWIAAWYFWLKSDRYDKWFWLSLLMFIFSCLSKGMAVTLPAALLISDLWKREGWKHVQWNKLLIMMIPAIFFGVLAIYAQQSGGNVREDQTIGAWQQIKISSWGIWFYISRTLIPYDLNIFYAYPKIDENGLPLKFTFSFLFTGLLMMTAFIMGLRIRSQPMLGLLFFLAVLFPVSQIIPVGNAIAADRYHYIPSIGLLLSLGWLADYFFEKYSKYARWTVIVFCLILMFPARERVMTWRNAETLWNAAIAQNPDLMFAYKNLAKYHDQQGRPDLAETIYRKALLQDSTYAVAWNELGVLLKNKGQNDEAFRYFMKSVALDSVNKEAYLNIGTYYDRKGESELARAAYQRSLALDSNYAEVWNNYGNSLSRSGNYDSAAVFFHRAIRIHPKYTEAYNNLGTNFAMQARYDSAITYFTKAVEIQGSYAEPMFNMAMVYARLEQIPEMQMWLQRAAANGHPKARLMLEGNSGQ